MKFKPPMCFSLDNAQYLVAKLDAILTGELGVAADHISRTHLWLVASFPASTQVSLCWTRSSRDLTGLAGLCLSFSFLIPG